MKCVKKIEFMTDEQIEQELEQIKQTPEYKTAQAEQRYKYRNRQRLYQARWLFNHGAELMKNGKDAEYFSNLNDSEEGGDK